MKNAKLIFCAFTQSINILNRVLNNKKLVLIPIFDL